MTSSIVALRAKELLEPIQQTLRWANSGFAPPSPSFIKRGILRSNAIPDAPWIETGTYLGNTTRYLARFFPHVITVEPSAWLYEHAKRRLLKQSNIELIHGTSEEVLPALLSRMTSPRINLWLDGHYSAGATYKGKDETPIARELQAIADQLHRIRAVTIFVDDVRCFVPGRSRDPNYPGIGSLTSWCAAHGFWWKVEHDIFIAVHDKAMPV